VDYIIKLRAGCFQHRISPKGLETLHQQWITTMQLPVYILGRQSFIKVGARPRSCRRLGSARGHIAEGWSCACSNSNTMDGGGQHEGLAVDYHNIMPASHHRTLIVYQAPVAFEELSTTLRPWFPMGNFHPIIRPVFQSPHLPRSPLRRSSRWDISLGASYWAAIGCTIIMGKYTMCF